MKVAVKRSNQRAGQLLAQGRYGPADALVQAARRVPDIRSRLKVVRDDWRTATSVDLGPGTPKGETTPMWGYYPLILKVLLELGGEASFVDLERHLRDGAQGSFKTGDVVVGRNGRARWQTMVKRARKAMVHEKWLEQRPLKLWRLTDEGRRVAADNRTFS